MDAKACRRIGGRWNSRTKACIMEDELFSHPFKDVAMTYPYAKEHFEDELEGGNLVQFTAELNLKKRTYRSVYTPEHKGTFVGRLT